MFRALLIAPNMELNIRPEVLSIQRAVRTEQLTGHVSLLDIFNVTRDQQFDIIHIASHGNSDGIQLSDETLGPDILARIARKCRAKLVYFNSCNSARLGQYLLDQGIPAIIMTSTEINDKQDAWSIAGYFYSELTTNGYDFRKAFRISKPDDGSLVWLSNGHYVEKELEPVMDELKEIRSLIEDQRQDTTRDINEVRDHIEVTRKKDLALVAAVIILFIVLAFTSDIYLYFKLMEFGLWK